MEEEEEKTFEQDGTKGEARRIEARRRLQTLRNRAPPRTNAAPQPFSHSLPLLTLPSPPAKVGGSGTYYCVCNAEDESETE